MPPSIWAPHQHHHRFHRTIILLSLRPSSPAHPGPPRLHHLPWEPIGLRGRPWTTPPQESENGRIYHVCMVRVVRGREGGEEDPEERETSPRYAEDPLPIMDHPREESTPGEEDEVGG